jgi:hypothetical protein
MQRSGNSDPGDPELEARLRAERPRPSAELVQRLVGGRSPRRPPARLTLRLAVAAALTTLLATAGMTVGGGDPIGAFEQAAQVANGKSGDSHGSGGKSSHASRNGNQGGGGQRSSGHGKPGDDQYGDKITICHRGNSPNNPGQTLTLPRQAAEAHLREHRYDTRGPCPPPPPPPDKQTICHRANKNDKGQTLTLSRQGAEQHLRNHRYDTRGPCPR